MAQVSKPITDVTLHSNDGTEYNLLKLSYTLICKIAPAGYNRSRGI